MVPAGENIFLVSVVGFGWLVFFGVARLVRSGGLLSMLGGVCRVRVGGCGRLVFVGWCRFSRVWLFGLLRI